MTICTANNTLGNLFHKRSPTHLSSEHFGYRILFIANTMIELQDYGIALAAIYASFSNQKQMKFSDFPLVTYFSLRLVIISVLLVVPV
jgi:hypothetical protein